MESSEYTLVEQARSGNRRALNQLFGRWYPRVYNLAHRYFGNADTAAEVSQQTFVAIQRGLGKLRDPQAFKAWLYRTAINCCHSQARKQKRRKEQREALSMATNGQPKTPYQQMRRNERSAIVLATLQQIPPEQREVIVMKEYENLKFREIAEILQLSENTVKSRLYYGLKAMRKHLEKRQLHKDLYYE